MTSNAQGNLVVPIWVEDGVIKPLVDDDGSVAVAITALDCEFDVILSDSDITLDVNLKSQSIVPDVNLKTSSITLPTSEQSPLTDIQARGYGYDGASWRKQGIIWGYHDRIYENLGGTTTGVQYNAQSTAVPAGYVHKVEFITARNISNAMTLCHIFLVLGGLPLYVQSIATLAKFIPITFVGAITLKEGDYLKITLNGCLSGETIQAGFGGYSMKIDE